ncbi:MAG TPA: carbohydrate kinase [Verrucomicrobiae bacterium]|jgi:fructokinase
MRFKVIGLGEVLWDLLPAGPQLGGAPANFAFHAHQLGAEVQVITRVGNDEHGHQVLRRFSGMDIDIATVQVDQQLPTGTASVVLGPDGTPRFTIRDHVAWDSLALTGEALEAVQTANAISFGTLAQRSAAASSVIQQLVSATPAASLRVFDVNLRQGFHNPEVLERSLTAANVLKLSDSELAVLTPILKLTGNVTQRIEQLAERFDLLLVAFTRGERGSLLYQRGEWSDRPGQKLHIVDTVGAGDAFTAALVMGLLNQFSLEDIHQIASDVATFVCSQPGATPLFPADLRATFAPNLTSF